MYQILHTGLHAVKPTYPVDSRPIIERLALNSGPCTGSAITPRYFVKRIDYEDSSVYFKDRVVTVLIKDKNAGVSIVEACQIANELSESIDKLGEHSQTAKGILMNSSALYQFFECNREESYRRKDFIKALVENMVSNGLVLNSIRDLSLEENYKNYCALKKASRNLIVDETVSRLLEGIKEFEFNNFITREKLGTFLEARIKMPIQAFVLPDGSGRINSYSPGFNVMNAVQNLTRLKKVKGYGKLISQLSKQERCNEAKLLGRYRELQYACDLMDLGYEVIELSKEIRSSLGNNEIDIIAKKDDETYAFEIKSSIHAFINNTDPPGQIAKLVYSSEQEGFTPVLLIGHNEHKIGISEELERFTEKLDEEFGIYSQRLRKDSSDLIIMDETFNQVGVFNTKDKLKLAA